MVHLVVQVNAGVNKDRQSFAELRVLEEQLRVRQAAVDGVPKVDLVELTAVLGRVIVLQRDTSPRLLYWPRC